MFIFRPIIIVLIINQIFTFFRCFALYVNEKNVDKVVLGMSHFYDFSRKMCHITKFLWEVKYEEGKKPVFKGRHGNSSSRNFAIPVWVASCTC